MSEEMRTGGILALQGVIEEMDTITAEMKRKGLPEPKEFPMLKQFIQDRMDDFREI